MSEVKINELVWLCSRWREYEGARDQFVTDINREVNESGLTIEQAIKAISREEVEYYCFFDRDCTRYVKELSEPDKLSPEANEMLKGFLALGTDSASEWKKAESDRDRAKVVVGFLIEKSNMELAREEGLL